MRLFPWTLVIGWLLLAGCEDPMIDPFTTGRHYTVYGYLNAFDNEHFVRVIPVRRSPEEISRPADPHAALDAVVTSTDLASGATVAWNHTLRQLDDGSYGHVFTSRFVVRLGHTYRLVIHRSDGAESIAETTVPNLGSPTVEPARVTPDSVTQVVRWPGAGVPDHIEVAYCAKPVGSLSCEEIVIDYGRSGRKTSGGWEVEVALGRDLRFVRQQQGFEDTLAVELSTVEMRFTSLDQAWQAPVGSFDPYVFAQPGALTNVENGFGFWGSVARSTYAWTPDPEVLDALGHVSPG